MNLFSCVDMQAQLCATPPKSLSYSVAAMALTIA